MREYECDLVWAASAEWQNWIHGKPIEFGQPMLKADRKSRKMDIVDRCKERKSVAHPKLDNISDYALEHRVYFPKSLDQAMQFIADLTGRQITIRINTKYWEAEGCKEKALNWYELATIILRSV